MQSFNPANGEVVWEGKESTLGEIHAAIKAARLASSGWKRAPLDERISLLERYSAELKKEKETFAELISQEVGKPLWESRGEVASMAQKISISIEAYKERCQERKIAQDSHELIITYRPHGVVAVFGPFNFPGHLPNGHIVPALLAGNAVLFKPSEHAPAVGEKILSCFQKAGVPKGIFQVIQGGPAVGRHLALHEDIDGLFFTGSFKTGLFLNEHFAKNPGKILALEMGGNNPLVVSEISDIQAAVYLTIQSAFITSGQRCSSARRLILPPSPTRKNFLETLIDRVGAIRVGAYMEQPEPFMGPLIDEEAAKNLMRGEEELLAKGALSLVPLKRLKDNRPFLTPGLIDVTPLKNPPDEELFGPLLQVIFVDSFAEALKEANRTAYGLTATLLGSSLDEWREFYAEVRAGIVNWNAPTTGANSRAPFGGIGKSGNHRPSAYLAADYCSYPVSSIQINHLQIPSSISPGIAL